MEVVDEAFRAHHRELLARMDEHLRRLETDGQLECLAQLVTFLERDLLPHARGEERHLYPAVEPLVQRFGRATATMAVDHEFIEAYVARLAQLARRAAGQPQQEHPTAVKEAAGLARELAAILRLHTEKEERVYLPLIQQHLTPGQQADLMAAMHEAPEGEGRSWSPTVLDVRPLPPARRHPLIFQAFDALGPGQWLELVNDHDPRPLYYQFAAERAGTFTWEYLEQGPHVWRVRIGRAGQGAGQPEATTAHGQ
ncbi:MAG TPA: DUF2249 domain-containing protein [Limnochordales bacterium]